MLILSTNFYITLGFEVDTFFGHMRSISETVSSMMKARFGVPLRIRLDAHRVNETQLNNIAHNVRKIGCIGIMDNITLH